MSSPRKRDADWSSIDSIAVEVSVSMLGKEGPTIYKELVALLQSQFPRVKHAKFDGLDAAWHRNIYARRTDGKAKN